MSAARTLLTTFLTHLWRTSPSLTVTGVLMVPMLLVALAGLVLDPRLIAGAPTWLKPAKFAASIAIYAFTMAWAFTYIPDWVRTRRLVGWITGVVLVVEMAIITLQAARGTASHFNFGTPLDATLFSIMGGAIMLQTLAAVAAAAALWRQRFDDRALGWALRVGLTVAIVGASTGGLMTSPTSEQLDQARGGQMTVVGAHTVGAPDGGPGLPGTNWSLEHGDLRVPHFAGLHAFQALPLVALVLPAAWPARRRTRLVAVAATSYTGLFVILLWQALRGEPLVGPGVATLSALALWALASGAGAWLADRPMWRRSSRRAQGAVRAA